MHIQYNADSFEHGNWEVTQGKEGHGFIQNYSDDRTYKYFCGYDFHLYLYNMDGSQDPMPRVPQVIKGKIVSMEKRSRKRAVR